MDDHGKTDLTKYTVKFSNDPNVYHWIGREIPGGSSDWTHVEINDDRHVFIYENKLDFFIEERNHDSERPPS